MITYEATVYVNVATDSQGRMCNFWGYEPTHPLAEVPDLPLCVQADSAQAAASLVFTIGNRMSEDAAGRTWPSDVRSVSVGDVVKLRSIGAPVSTHFLAVESLGWRDLVEPCNPIVPLVGSSATSRVATS